MDLCRSMVCNNLVTNSYRRSHRAWFRPLQWCSASGHPCVHYSYVVPVIIHVSITVMECRHLSMCPLQWVFVSITMASAGKIMSHYLVPTKHKMSMCVHNSASLCPFQWGSAGKITMWSNVRKKKKKAESRLLDLWRRLSPQVKIDFS